MLRASKEDETWVRRSFWSKRGKRGERASLPGVSRVALGTLQARCQTDTNEEKKNKRERTRTFFGDRGLKTSASVYLCARGKV